MTNQSKLINFSSLDDLYQYLIELIDNQLPQSGKIYTIGKFTGMGWLFATDDDACVPLVSLKRYDKTVNVYITIEGDAVAKSAHVFGKSAVGKSCIRIKSFSVDKEEQLIALLEQTKDSFIPEN